ncbi:MAG: ABC transporter ATP-binding protein [Candidatus Amoebophilus sp. 36-38]|nr:MAG: ABC transporter ATP-binding protein [Candidatus Amoebophilus sp. 36-38]
MIEFNHISKSFDGKLVLDDISGHFQRGKISLVIGTSGTGKSVLLKCIVGLIQPSHGSITFDGRDILGGSRNTIISIKREIGMLFQGGALFDSKNIEENVMFPLDMLTDMPKSEKLDRVNFCLERVGLSNVNKKLPSELSGGMQKRVGIARAIVNNSKYLFCDEPNSGLDPQTSLLIDELIQELTHEYNITTVIVTHNLDTIFTVGDRILFLDQGKKAWEGTSKELFHTDVQSLKDFLFASRMLQLIKSPD